MVRVGKARFQAGLPLGGRAAVLAAFFAALVLATLFVDSALSVLAAAVLAALFVLAALVLAALVVTAFKHLKYGGKLGGWRCAPHAGGAGGTARAYRRTT